MQIAQATILMQAFYTLAVIFIWKRLKHLTYLIFSSRYFFMSIFRYDFITSFCNCFMYLLSCCLCLFLKYFEGFSELDLNSLSLAPYNIFLQVGILVLTAAWMFTKIWIWNFLNVLFHYAGNVFSDWYLRCWWWLTCIMCDN